MKIESKTIQCFLMETPSLVSDRYNCDNPKAGIALIFNHKQIKDHEARNETEKDRDDLKQTLSMYGYDVRVYNDLTVGELREVLSRVAEEDHRKSDCLIVAVLSDGVEGQVFASDKSYPVENLWDPFLGKNCKTLVNKPKLFFIQASRGKKLEQPATYPAEASQANRKVNIEKTAITPASKLTEQPKIKYKIPNTADILIMYSTFQSKVWLT